MFDQNSGVLCRERWVKSEWRGQDGMAKLLVRGKRRRRLDDRSGDLNTIIGSFVFSLSGFQLKWFLEIIWIFLQNPFMMKAALCYRVMDHIQQPRIIRHPVGPDLIQETSEFQNHALSMTWSWLIPSSIKEDLATKADKCDSCIR